MSYLRTVLSYNVPSQAELDKSFLESYGLTVHLMNNETTRNELGPLFWVQLQVADEEWAEANRILREAHPERFGSVERVKQLDRLIKRKAAWALAGAVVLGLLAYYFAPAIWASDPADLSLREQQVLSSGLVGAITGWRISGK